MENRVVVRSDDNCTFNVEKNNGEIVIEVHSIVKDVVKQVAVADGMSESNEQAEIENYKKPPIPVGYKYVEGTWEDGFVIERKKDRSQFVWVPVGALDNDGTLDNKHFNEKFGRRFIGLKELNNIHDGDSGKFCKQYCSVMKYGGFYISRYLISGMYNPYSESYSGLLSIKGGTPRELFSSLREAREVAEKFEDGEMVQSHLIYGAEYDSMFAWFIKTCGGRKELYNKTKNINGISDLIKATGVNEENCLNRIYDYCGRFNVFTQEEYNASEYGGQYEQTYLANVVRGLALHSVGAEDATLSIKKVFCPVWAIRRLLYLRVEDKNLYAREFFERCHLRIALYIDVNAECYYIQ